MSRRTSAVSRPARLGLALVAAALLTSCVRLPTTGPVVEEPGNGEGADIGGPRTDPRPPQPGDTPQDIAAGFLNAMTATPIRTTVAAQFLTHQARSDWSPQSRTILYSSAPISGDQTARVRLRGAHSLGPRGEWQGSLPPAQATVVLPMRLEAPGRWRITRAPDALIVPTLWYEQQFQPATLYFFDPTGRILVPEPVHVPTGPQLANNLVRALLLGPPDGLDQVVRSFIPPGLSLALAVTVSRQGVALVALKGPISGPLPRRTSELMLAQLAWTLRQVPSVKSFQVTMAGRPVTDSTGGTTFPVRGYARFDPTANGASAQLYALRQGRLVSGEAHHLTAVDGPFGVTSQGIGAFGVSLDDTRIAGVTPYRLLVGPVRQGSRIRQAYAGAGRLLRPSWDFAGRIWDVDRAPGGARVVVVYGGHSHRVKVPGVTGERITRFLVSRDGSRLAAVVRGPHRDRLVVARIRYDAQGQVRGATDTRKLPWEAGGSPRITDIGWASPTSVDVLHQLTRQYAEVRQIAVDGSTQQSEASTATIDLARQPGATGNSIQGRVLGLVTSPVNNDLSETQSSFAILPRSLVDLDQASGNPPVPFRGLTHITYAG